jgi:maleylpyruvate isomerase
MDTSTTLPPLDDTLLATSRYLAALTLLDDASLRGPSVLPGWSRAHVVAHVSRNADAFTRVLEQASAGLPAAMYPSAAARDADIEETVRMLDPGALVEDARRSSARFEEAARACTAGPDACFARVDGAPETTPLTDLVFRRRAEVEIHHSDLDVGYAPAGWPTDFSVTLVGQRQDEMARLPDGCPSLVLSSVDVPGLWKLGVGQGPEVSGAVGDLAWWLVGRGGGRGLTCSAGALPTLERWR